MNQGQPAQPQNPAETYEQYFVPAMFVPWTNILLGHAALGLDKHVLDVACGTGIVARQVAPLVGVNGQVVALDINPAMLAVARGLPASTGASIEWVQGNALALPFADERFDLVVCQHGLQFVPDRTRAVLEMHRVLKPGGQALVIVLQTLEQHPVFEALMQSLAQHLGVDVSQVMTPFALSRSDDLQTLFTTAGFERVTIYSESTTVRFPQPERFVPLAVMSSAAAIPALIELDAPSRAALLESVRLEVEPTLARYRNADAITFPMFANVALAIKSSEP